jgi:hypothetical protein
MITLQFDSVTARKQNSSNKPEDFTVKFNPSLRLDPSKKWGVGLVKLQGSYTWHNIEVQRNNNLVKYSPDAGVTWKDVLFPDGVYTYTDIKNYIQYVMKQNGDYTVVDGDDTYDFDLNFSFSTFLITIELKNGFQLDLVSQSFADLIGFDVGILPTGITEGVRLPNINNSLDVIYVRTNIAHSSYVNGTASDIIYAYPTARLSRGFPYQFESVNIQMIPLVTTEIPEVRMYITDQFGQSIDLNSVDCSFTLVIQEMPK